jgi:hypothetical protein
MSSKQTLNFIGNEFVASHSGKFFENRSPLTAAS